MLKGSAETAALLARHSKATRCTLSLSTGRTRPRWSQERWNMKLEKVQITDFRCIDDSTEFKISDITCLVGKNESGKTTCLQAIEPLNPQNKAHAEYDRVRDYPRKHLSDYDTRHGGAAGRGAP